MNIFKNELILKRNKWNIIDFVHFEKLYHACYHIYIIRPATVYMPFTALDYYLRTLQVPKVSNIRHNKSQSLNVSRLIL